MASMRKLNSRLATWHRYAHKTYWNPRVTRPRWMPPGSATACSPVGVSEDAGCTPDWLAAEIAYAIFTTPDGAR